ncbi:hypothetical protein Syun_023543 [Stephania yunnanensis]|uniref:Thioredoxin domain-containing protein n=1 Tax=Stephania yunnanensis TaxID=152371 RepID=A0AAP0I2B6_9MAGN
MEAMAGSLRCSGSCMSSSGLDSKRGFNGYCSSMVRFADPLKNKFWGNQVLVSDQQWVQNGSASASLSVHCRSTVGMSRAMRWWEKTLKPNMMEIGSAQELQESLRNAGDRLVIIDFYSPGCGGCKALHPKICQLAEENPTALFLKVNYEELKNMCYSLHIHVLPFFRFYRGAEGRLCSFSCTNATIKKFKDALAKHGADRCNLGPAKGLEESELQALAANREISKDYLLRCTRNGKMGEDFFKEIGIANCLSSEDAIKMGLVKEKQVALMARSMS